jgi:dolichol kinase
MVSPSRSPSVHSEALDLLVDEVRDFVDRIQQPRVSDESWKMRMQRAGHDLSAKVAKFAAEASEKQAATYDSMRALAERLRAYSEELAARPNVQANVQALRERKEALSRSYEEFLIELRERRVTRAAALAQSRQLKPVNYARNIFHAMNGLIGMTMYGFFLTREGALIVLGVIFAVFGTLEVTRRFSDRWNDFLVDKVFGAISRPSERYRTNSATLYLLALLVIVAAFPKLPVLAAVLVLGFGDPVASLVGKRWGRKKLFRDKSYAGTLAFFTAGIIAVGAMLSYFAPELGILRIVGVAAAISAVGAVTELLSSRIDDNFSIPIACALIGTLLL